MGLQNRLTFGSLVRRASQLASVMRHPVRHWRTLHIVAVARRHGLATADSSTGWKYLGEYLAGGFGTAARSELIISHYRYLLSRLPDNALRRELGGGVMVWHRSIVDVSYAIRLAQAALCPMEGEAELAFYRDGLRLFTLTFTLVDGGSLGLSRGTIMFIGGMQGGFACQMESRAAARDNGEIAPAAMLIVAARAVAEALSVAKIAGVSSRRQAAAGHAGEKIRFRYNDWWEQVGSRRIEGGLFMLDPIGPRCRDHLSAAHRRRAIRKEGLKMELAAEMLFEFQRRMAEPPIECLASTRSALAERLPIRYSKLVHG